MTQETKGFLKILKNECVKGKRLIPIPHDYAMNLLLHIAELETELKELKKQKDDVAEYIKENKDKTIAPYGDNEDTDYEICLFEEDINILLRMLGEIDE